MTAALPVHIPFSLREALEFTTVYIVVVLVLCMLICGPVRGKR
jgi:hypothetical protein